MSVYFTDCTLSGISIGSSRDNGVHRSDVSLFESSSKQSYTSTFYDIFLRSTARDQITTRLGSSAALMATTSSVTTRGTTAVVSTSRDTSTRTRRYSITDSLEQTPTTEISKTSETSHSRKDITAQSPSTSQQFFETTSVWPPVSTSSEHGHQTTWSDVSNVSFPSASERSSSSAPPTTVTSDRGQTIVPGDHSPATSRFVYILWKTSLFVGW